MSASRASRASRNSWSTPSKGPARTETRLAAGSTASYSPVSATNTARRTTQMREAGVAALPQPGEETSERVLDALQRPAAHVGRIGAVAERVVGADGREAILLVEAGDGLACEAPSVAELLQGGVVEQALALQPLFEQPVLGPRRLELLAIRQDHVTRPENMWNGLSLLQTAINPKRRSTRIAKGMRQGQRTA